MNYIKLFEDGTSEAVDVKPSWGMYEKEHALDDREVHIDGNWYSTTGGELLVGTDFSDGLLGNWTSVNNGVPTIVNNQLKIVDASPYSSGVEQTITCNIGDKIVVKYYTSGIRAAALWLDSLILYSSDTGTYIGEVSEEFIATSTSHIISLQTGSSIDRDDLYIDNISVYKVEPTIDTLQPPHTYLSNKGKLAGIEVANGIPVDIHYDELAPTLVEDTIKATDLVTNTLTLAETKWSNADGIEYFDDGLLGVPDTSFSSTGARLYPDGTIRGKSDYGDYIKSPDGEASASLVDATILGTGTQVFFPTTIFHASFSFSSAGGSFRHLQVLTSSNTSLTLLGFNSSGTAQNVTLISCDINGEWK